MHFFLLSALCDHRFVRAGGDGGLGDALRHPPVEKASSLAVDLAPAAQDQRVPRV